MTACALSQLAEGRCEGSRASAAEISGTSGPGTPLRSARPAITPDRTGPVARVEELVALADVVKVSDEDLHWLHPDDEPVATAARWADAGPGLVVVTRGGAGVDVHTAHGVEHCPAFDVEVVDTTGAGDAFCGSLAARLAAGDGLRDAADPYET